jgi:hypothetical protein
MYFPSKPSYKVEDLILVENLGSPIIQLLLGYFIPSTDILGVAVLHPKHSRGGGEMLLVQAI